MGTIRQMIRSRLGATGTRLGNVKEECRKHFLQVVITPVKKKNGRKVLPAQGYTRAQRRKDRTTHIFLAKIAAAKRLAAKIARRKKAIKDFRVKALLKSL